MNYVVYEGTHVNLMNVQIHIYYRKNTASSQFNAHVRSVTVISDSKYPQDIPYPFNFNCNFRRILIEVSATVG